LGGKPLVSRTCIFVIVEACNPEHRPEA